MLAAGGVTGPARKPAGQRAGEAHEKGRDAGGRFAQQHGKDRRYGTDRGLRRGKGVDEGGKALVAEQIPGQAGREAAGAAQPSGQAAALAEAYQRHIGHQHGRADDAPAGRAEQGDELSLDLGAAAAEQHAKDDARKPCRTRCLAPRQVFGNGGHGDVIDGRCRGKGGRSDGQHKDLEADFRQELPDEPAVLF